MMFGVSSECCFYSFLSFFRPSVFLSRIYLACKGTQTRHLFTTHKAGILLKTVRMQTFRLTWRVPFFMSSRSLSPYAYILLFTILSMLSYVCDFVYTQSSRLRSYYSGMRYKYKHVCWFTHVYAWRTSRGIYRQNVPKRKHFTKIKRTRREKTNFRLSFSDRAALFSIGICLCRLSFYSLSLPLVDASLMISMLLKNAQ